MNAYKIALITILSGVTFGYMFFNMIDPKLKPKPSTALITLAINGTTIWLAVMA